MDDEIMTLDEILQDPYYMDQYNKRIQATTALTGYPKGMTKGIIMDNETNTQETTEKTFTQEDLNRVGAKEKKQGEAAILKEFGLSSKDEIAAIKEILEAHNAAQASKMTAADIQKAFDEYKTKEDGEKATIIAEREQARQEAWCAKNGIPDDKADFYLFKINKLMAAGEIDFATTAAQYLKDNPVEVNQGDRLPMWGGSGRKQIPSMTKEEFSKLGYSERLDLKTKQPELYKEMTKKE